MDINLAAEPIMIELARKGDIHRNLDGLTHVQEKCLFAWKRLEARGGARKPFDFLEDVRLSGTVTPDESYERCRQLQLDVSAGAKGLDMNLFPHLCQAPTGGDRNTGSGRLC